jgi:hypothetical protein
MEWNLTDLGLPRNVRDAVDILLPDLGEDTLTEIRSTDYENLIDFHFSLGTLIRRVFMLHENPALMEDTGMSNPDDASLKIIEALWRRMRH